MSKSVLILGYPGVQMLDLVGPLEVLSGANELMRIKRAREVPYDIRIVSHGTSAPGFVASNGFRMSADRTTPWLPKKIDLLVIPGALQIEPHLADRELIRWIARAAARSQRVASVCSGAFLAAKAGLLLNREATTHWAGIAQFRRLFPEVRLQPDAIFVHDGPISTSAGVTAGMDLILALVEQDLGHEAALELARWFVMFLKRPGGQAQFSSHLKAQIATTEPLQKLLSWIAEHPCDDLSVEALARKTGLSPRHFARVFLKETGVTPAEHVLAVRIERARLELEQTHEGLKGVAARSGFGSEESLRRAFHARLGLSPGEYRERFQSKR